ncbi:MAG: hypothetical protein AB1633_09130, partial [Elusimicrobiota bacterium]
MTVNNVFRRWVILTAVFIIICVTASLLPGKSVFAEVGDAERKLGRAYSQYVTEKKAFDRRSLIAWGIVIVLATGAIVLYVMQTKKFKTEVKERLDTFTESVEEAKKSRKRSFFRFSA